MSKEAEVKNVTGTDTTDEESMVKIILDDKKQQHAPQHVPDTNTGPLGGEFNKDTLLVKTSTYHHPHHPARKQPTWWQLFSNNDNNPRTTNREVLRSNHSTSTQRNCQYQLPSQAREARARSRIHLSLGWLDARAWYQWTTLLSRSYYLCSSYVSGTKHV